MAHPELARRIKQALGAPDNKVKKDRLCSALSEALVSIGYTSTSQLIESIFGEDADISPEAYSICECVAGVLEQGNDDAVKAFIFFTGLV